MKDERMKSLAALWAFAAAVAACVACVAVAAMFAVKDAVLKTSSLIMKEG